MTGEKLNNVVVDKSWLFTKDLSNFSNQHIPLIPNTPPPVKSLVVDMEHEASEVGEGTIYSKNESLE